MHEVPWGPEAARVTAGVPAPLHGSHNQTLSRSRTDEDLPLQGHHVDSSKAFASLQEGKS